uniref:Uncharacterized protein n=1 Tax=Helianthus annuus TaxID=4232 RepID=A0A251RZS5_HELAN
MCRTERSLSQQLKLDYPHQITSCGCSCKCKHSHWILHLLLHTLNYVEAIASQDSEKGYVSPATGVSNHNKGYRELANWGSLETNRIGYTTFSSMAYSTLEEVDIAQRDSLTSIECSFMKWQWYPPFGKLGKIISEILVTI